MKQLIFDKAYFGMFERNGYSNYANKIKEPDFLNKFEECSKCVSGKILELGCSLGTYTKLALEKNLDWTGLDGSAFCFENKETMIIQSDALMYLNAQWDKKYDFIVSFDFLECNDNEYLGYLKKQMDRVSTNQIHYSRKTLNEKYYNTNVRKIIDEGVIIG